ncbi:MAG: 16S rRNA (uracil(1498)-N(3))-methyltransferase [Chromatocurvus sp.]
MQRPRFFTRQTLATGESVVLEEEPARHIGRTLRMQPGDALVLFNGEGAEYTAEILSADRKHVEVRCLSAADPVRESPLAIELAIGMSRGDRMDWVVQKATELGVTAISPLQTARSGLNLRGERLEKKILHWQRIAASACEQCGRNRLPAVNLPLSLDDWVAGATTPLRLVLDHRATDASPWPTAPAAIALLVGPEGGLASNEVDSACAQGFRALALGPRVMRTETAPLAAISVLQARWGDFAL